MAATKKAEQAAPSNLRLWEKLCKTPKDVQKPFNTGQFKGTDINITYRIKLATDVFGPAGVGWGCKVLAEGFQSGAAVDTGNGKIEHESMHWLRIQFWYIDPVTKERGEIEQYGQTQYLRWVRKSGYWSADYEAPKKSMTDAMGKCFSLLGQGADIYSGRWDESKYAGFHENDPNRAAPQGPASASRSPAQQPQRQSPPPAAAMSAPPAQASAPPSNIAQIDRLNWTKLMELTGYDSTVLRALANAREYPTSSKKMTEPQKFQIRFDMLLKWAESHSGDINEIATTLAESHHDLSDQALHERVAGFTNVNRPNREAV